MTSAQDRESASKFVRFYVKQVCLKNAKRATFQVVANVGKKRMRAKVLAASLNTLRFMPERLDK